MTDRPKILIFPLEGKQTFFFWPNFMSDCVTFLHQLNEMWTLSLHNAIWHGRIIGVYCSGFLTGASESTPLNKLAVADDARANMPVDGLNMTLAKWRVAKVLKTSVLTKKMILIQGSPVSSKVEKTAVFSMVFSTWKKPFIPVSSTEIRKKLKNGVKLCFLC